MCALTNPRRLCFNKAVKKIPITHGLYALVDDADHKIIGQWKWSASRLPSGIVYAVRGTHLSRPRRSVMYLMHREIMGCKRGDGIIVDHINANGLDNRRSNLRCCTKGQNLQRGNKPKGKARLRGVTKHGKKWVASITFNRRTRYLGLFKTKRNAADRYDEEALRLFGIHALTNFGPRARSKR